MRAPRWFRTFRDWRWAPCFALILGALGFVGLALLFIPAQFGSSARADTPLHSLELPSTKAPRAVVPASLRAPLTPSAPAAAESASPAVHAPAPAEAPPAEPATNLAVQDFSANIADRGDRPISPVRR